MNDKTEVEYLIGELKTKIQEVRDMKGRELWDKEVKRLQDEKKEIEADLKKTKEKLAEAQTNRAAYDTAISDYEDHIRTLEELLPNMLTEAEAVQAFKNARSSGKFDTATHTFKTETRTDAERFRKAAYSLEATVSTEPHFKDEMWTVHIFQPYEAHYRDFLYDEE